MRTIKIAVPAVLAAILSLLTVCCTLEYDQVGVEIQCYPKIRPDSAVGIEIFVSINVPERLPKSTVLTISRAETGSDSAVQVDRIESSEISNFRIAHHYVIVDYEVVAGTEYTYLASLEIDDQVWTSEFDTYVSGWVQSFRTPDKVWNKPKFAMSANGTAILDFWNNLYFFDGSAWSRFLPQAQAAPVEFGFASVGFDWSGRPVVTRWESASAPVEHQVRGPDGEWTQFLEPTPDSTWVYAEAVGPYPALATLAKSHMGDTSLYLHDGSGWSTYVLPRETMEVTGGRLEFDGEGVLYAALIGTDPNRDPQTDPEEPVIVYQPVNGWLRLPMVAAAQSSPGLFDLTIDSSDAPIVAFSESSTGPVEVRRYNGSSWDMFGSPIHATTTIEKVEVECTATGQCFVMIDDQGYSNPVVWRTKGGDWTQLDRDGFGPSSNLAGSGSFGLVGGEIPIVAYIVDGRGFVYEYKAPIE